MHAESLIEPAPAVASIDSAPPVVVVAAFESDSLHSELGIAIAARKEDEAHERQRIVPVLASAAGHWLESVAIVIVGVVAVARIGPCSAGLGSSAGRC